MEKPTLENEFGKFFYMPHYILLKNYLFNYRMRKRMVHLAFFRYFGKSLKKDFLIADIGPGVSPVSPAIDKTLFIELEDKAIEYVRKKGYPIIKGDITRLPLNDNSVDAIVCSEVLEHVPEYNKGLHEIARVLKKNGAAIITVPIHNYYWKDDDDFVGHLRRFEPSILQADIERAGLTVIERKPIGSLLERWLTWIMIKTARKSMSKIKKSTFDILIYRMANEVLFHAIRLACIFNSEKNSSIILFLVSKRS